jgi:hypothetical protein
MIAGSDARGLETWYGFQAAPSAWDPTGIPGGSPRVSSVGRRVLDRPDSITNRDFLTRQRTGHVTFAEKKPDPKDYPGALPHMLRAGSLVFSPPLRQVDLATGGMVGSPAPMAPAYGRAARSPDCTTIRSHVVRRRGLRQMGRQGVADRGR